MAEKIRIGDLLIANGIITEEQLLAALAQQKSSGEKLGAALISLGFITDAQFLEFLSKQLNIPYIELEHYEFNPGLIKRLPETFARRFRALPLKEENGSITIGMVDPLDLFASDELSRVLQSSLKLAIVREKALIRSIDLLYRKTDAIKGFATELSQQLAGVDIELGQLGLDETDDTPVVRLLQSLFEDAVQVGASDIHIEPDKSVLRVRQRIDGVLHEHLMDEVKISSALTLRLKLMAGLDISERRIPQDGRFHLTVRGKAIDVRLSTMPAQHGESVVMRLLDQSNVLVSLQSLGMPETIMHKVMQVLSEPHGMLLVTGPTGSGKTTTLYSALSILNQPETKIITVEDPVEYSMPRINQVQVNSRIGLDFARVLRASLRQDPDVIMVGEIRDAETANIGMRAAITGHLVLATLHTNDVLSSAVRLIDMGVEGYMVASALRAVLAQRLVRRICEYCKESAQLSAAETSWVETFAQTFDGHQEFSAGAGCPHCNQTGYRGRIGIYELLQMNQDLVEAMRLGDQRQFAKLVRAQPDYSSLTDSALVLAREGLTSISEVVRVTGSME